MNVGASRARRARRLGRRRRGRGSSGTWGGACIVASWGVRNGLALCAGFLLFMAGCGFVFQLKMHHAETPSAPVGFNDAQDDETVDNDKIRIPRDPPNSRDSRDILSSVHGLPPRPPPQTASSNGAITEEQVVKLPPQQQRPGAGHGGGEGKPAATERPPPANEGARAGRVAGEAERMGASGLGRGGSGSGGDVVNLGSVLDPADDVTMADVGMVSEAGPLETFLASGGKLPIVLLTCNRDKLLKQTIESLRAVRGLDMTTVMVLQDGTDSKVEAIARDNGLYLKQNRDTPGLRGGPRAGDDGAKRIAMHYKFSLNHAFDARPDAPGVVIVEDDLLFSPDFLEYLEANAPVLERDPTTFVLSAWNDNGFRGRVSDKTELKRTPYFPGLGWLLPRKLFQELGPRWPKEHWDHWLRDKRQHIGRECVYPEVPRTYHNGVQGTFMSTEMHNKLFKNIDYNVDDSFSWVLHPDVAEGDKRAVGAAAVYAKAISSNYEKRLEARIRSARHINDLNDLPTSSTVREGEQIVMWYSLEQTEEESPGRGRKSKGPPFQPLSSVFGIWHEYRRGEHAGMHSFRYEGNSNVMLINVAKSPYESLKPRGLLAAPMNSLRGLSAGAGGADIDVTAGESASSSCDNICSRKGMRCKESMFEVVNSCSVLKDHFPCAACEESYGFEQPCYVQLDAPPENYPGRCLISSNPRDSKCSASHPLTRRLCPCSPA